MSRLNPVAAAGFARAADVYDRARPSYPEEAVAWMARRTGLGPGSTVVDVGAGTGKLTRLLPTTGAHVIAVEPVTEMRAKLDGVQVLDGTAEEIPLTDGSADVITVAQAFHWFDHDLALPELHRVLRPGGHLVLFWNNRDLADPIQRGVEELLRPLRGSVGSRMGRGWREPLERSPLFGPVEVRNFRYEQQFTADDLCDRVSSTSFVASMSSDDRDALLARVRALTHGVAEPFPFPYKTEIFVIPRRGDRGPDSPSASIEG